MIEVVAANLAYYALNPPKSGGIALDLRNGDKGRSRYDNPALTAKTLSPLVKVLWLLDIVNKKLLKSKRGESTSIKPAPALLELINGAGISLQDFGRDELEELILLNRVKFGDFDYESNSVSKTRERVDYKDTPETVKMRGQMRRLNEWLAGADVRFIPDGGEPVDQYDRVMRRIFNTYDESERFDNSGRLFGGFWQRLNKARRKSIRVNGEEVVDVDFAAMFVRLAYATIGAVPPAGDLYEIPGLGGYRSGVKLAVNLMFNGSGKRTKWPKGMGVGVGDDEAASSGEVPAAEYDARLPPGWTVAKTMTAILAHHPALAEVVQKGIGPRLMHLESNVLLEALEVLMARNIPALGLHDGLLCPASKVDEVEGIMSKASYRVVGVALPTARK